MTEGSFESLCERVADLWQSDHGDATPVDVWGQVRVETQFLKWLREKEIPLPTVTQRMRLAAACSARARGLKKAARMLQPPTREFQPGSEG